MMFLANFQNGGTPYTPLAFHGGGSNGGEAGLLTEGGSSLPSRPSGHALVWWPEVFLSKCPMVYTPYYPYYLCMTFDLSNALHSGQGLLVPNLMGLEHPQAF